MMNQRHQPPVRQQPKKPDNSCHTSITQNSFNISESQDFDNSKSVLEMDYNNDDDVMMSETSESAAAAAKEAATAEASKSENNKSPSQPSPFVAQIYSQREYIFVICAGMCLSFNSGYINGCCLSGFLTHNGVKQSVAAFTGAYTTSALFLMQGDGSSLDDFSFQIYMILSFYMGALLAGIITPNATAYRLEPTYGPTFMLGGIFLAIGSILAALQEEYYFFFLAAAANGIQNGVSSLYSANLIRSTHLTGTTTDIGLFSGQLLRGNRANFYKMIVLISLAVSFWTGGIISFVATQQFASHSLLFSAGFYMFIGLSLVVFLMAELDVTFMAAMFGTWNWKTSIDKLQQSFFENNGDNDQQFLSGLFDQIDVDQSGTIDRHELQEALNRAGFKNKSRIGKILIRHADTDGDGVISKAEWDKACQLSALPSPSSSNKASVSRHHASTVVVEEEEDEEVESPNASPRRATVEQDEEGAESVSLSLRSALEEEDKS